MVQLVLVALTNSLCLFPVASLHFATLLPGLVDGLWVALPLNPLHVATVFPDLVASWGKRAGVWKCKWRNHVLCVGSDLCGWLGSCNEKVKPPKPELGVHFCDPKINDFLVLFFRPWHVAMYFSTLTGWGVDLRYVYIMCVVHWIHIYITYHIFIYTYIPSKLHDIGWHRAMLQGYLDVLTVCQRHKSWRWSTATALPIGCLEKAGASLTQNGND